jgi:hypothetical protein
MSAKSSLEEILFRLMNVEKAHTSSDASGLPDLLNQIAC